MTAPVANLKTAAESELAAQYADVRAGFTGGAEALAQRDAAFAIFAKSGLPHRRVEAWHYTDLRAKLRHVPKPARQPDAAAIAGARARLASIETFGAARVVMLDGRFVAELSDPMPEGARAIPHVETLLPPGAETDAMAALNTASMQTGAGITIDEGAKLARPIVIVWMTSGASVSHGFVCLLAKNRSEVSILELRETLSGSLLNDSLLVSVGDDAHVQHIVIQTHPHDATDIVTLSAQIGARARFESLAANFGGGLTRRQNFIRFVGEHAHLSLRGLSLLRGKQHADNTLVVDHAAPHGTSREFFRHIIEDEATGVFQGKIVVKPGAQKTDGVMKSNALLLSPDAAMMNKPELEIFADDVVCGHGATCGELNQDHIFYLMARGLPRPEAEALLLEAFASEVIETIEHEPLREALAAHISGWLAARAHGGQGT